jgi:hypothetical protein
MPRFAPLPSEKVLRFVQAHPLRSVIRLPEGIGKCLDQMRSLPRENRGLSFFKGHNNERCPAGMDA